ncbi:MAG: hypothetical protein CMF27_04855 [Kiritimatiellaceae bacterium]|nr:hypothetical protein [Kiritimatiellaceae bacterium]
MPHVHFMGIGGVGMNGLAQLAVHHGYEVSGSDRGYQPQTNPYRQLERIGIQINPQDGHHLPAGVERVVYSTAIEPDNPELVYAQERNIPCLHRAEFLNQLIPTNAQLIAVAGTAGKTTTVGLLGYIFEQAGLNPTIYNGAAVLNWRNDQHLGNVRCGKKNLWIIEADESDRSLLHFNPTHALLTNLGEDHYSLPELNHIFDQFRSQTQSYFMDARTCEIYTPLPKNKLLGRHNQINISNAIQFAIQLGIAKTIIQKAITSFEGIERRLEKIGSFQNIDIYDDYAHNPMKIEATMNALKEAYPQQTIHVIWRPHAFKSLVNQFDAYVDVFNTFLRDTNNSLSLLPVYYAGGTVEAEKTSEDLASALLEKDSRVNLFNTYDELHSYLIQNNPSIDILLGMGARDPQLPLFLRSLISC